MTNILCASWEPLQADLILPIIYTIEDLAHKALLTSRQNRDWSHPFQRNLWTVVTRLFAQDPSGLPYCTRPIRLATFLSSSYKCSICCSDIAVILIVSHELRDGILGRINFFYNFAFSTDVVTYRVISCFSYGVSWLLLIERISSQINSQSSNIFEPVAKKSTIYSCS